MASRNMTKSYGLTLRVCDLKMRGQRLQQYVSLSYDTWSQKCVGGGKENRCDK